MLDAKHIYSVPLEDIFVDEVFNCRGKIFESEIEIFAKDIKEQGLINPVTLRQSPEGLVAPNGTTPPYSLVAGFRRYTAFSLLAKTDPFFKKIPAIVKLGMTDSEARLVNLRENIVRKDLNILQEARAIQHLFDEGMTQEGVGALLGQSKGWAQVRMMLMTFPPDIQKDAEDGNITQTDIREIYMIKETADRYDYVRRVKEYRLNGKKRVPRPVRRETADNAKRCRLREEIFKMQSFIYGKMGNNIATKSLAWAAGEVTDAEIFAALYEYAQDNGLDFVMPTKPLSQMVEEIDFY